MTDQKIKIVPFILAILCASCAIGGTGFALVYLVQGDKQGAVLALFLGGAGAAFFNPM